MKKLILGLIVVFGFSLTSIGETYECTVSSDKSQNAGYCKELSSGNGDMCFIFGEDDDVRCNKTNCIGCVEDPIIN